MSSAQRTRLAALRRLAWPLAAVAVAAAGAATLVLLALNGEGLRQIVFGYSLGGALLRDLQGVVRETLQPASVDVWLAASSLPLRGRVGEGVGR